MTDVGQVDRGRVTDEVRDGPMARGRRQRHGMRRRRPAGRASRGTRSGAAQRSRRCPPTEPVYASATGRLLRTRWPPCSRRKGDDGTCRCRCWWVPARRWTASRLTCPSDRARPGRGVLARGLTLVASRSSPRSRGTSADGRHRRASACRCTPWRSRCCRADRSDGREQRERAPARRPRRPRRGRRRSWATRSRSTSTPAPSGEPLRA